MVYLKIKLQKEAYFPGDEVEGWMELKHKGFKPTIVDKLVMKVDGEEFESVMVMQAAQTTSRNTLIDCKQVLLDQQVRAWCSSPTGRGGCSVHLLGSLWCCKTSGSQNLVEHKVIV